jgi:hypothetical protein
MPGFNPKFPAEARNVRAAVPSEEPNNEVEAKLDRVNELWMRVERKLLNRQPPRHITVEVCYHQTGEDGDYLERHYLGIQKMHGKWRLCHAVEWPQYDEREPHPSIPDNLPWKPITECDLETRIEMSEHVHKLQFEVDNTRTFFIPQLDQTISRLEGALDAD